MADEAGIEDFGFSMTTEESIKKSEKDSAQAIQDEVTKAQTKLRKVKDKIWPLLVGLKKDAHLEVIKWPNRVEVIDKLMQDITTIIAE
jgi:hypothetical protein